VYPTVNDECGRFPGFVVESTTTSILNLSYENALFFQFLEGPMGPQGMIQAFHTLPAMQPIGAHVAALSTWPNISNIWHEFGQAVVDNTMVDTGGQAIGLDTAWSGSVSVKLTDDFDLPTQDFTLARYQLVLGSGQGFHVSVAHTDGEIVDATKPSGTGDWGPVLIDRETGCATYYVLPTSTGASTDTRTYTLHGVVDQPNAEGSVCDPCVVGRWRMDHASYWSMFDAIMSETEGFATTLTATSGELELEFGNDGNLVAQAMPFTAETVSTMPDAQGNPAPVGVAMTFSGGDTMSYLALDGQLFLETVIQGIDLKMMVSIGGQQMEAPFTPSETPFFGGGSPGPVADYAYVCSASHLTLIPLFNQDLYKGRVWDFDKVGNAP
jgi:hypothetical protein